MFSSNRKKKKVGNSGKNATGKAKGKDNSTGLTLLKPNATEAPQEEQSAFFLVDMHPDLMDPVEHLGDYYFFFFLFFFVSVWNLKIP